MFLLNYKLEQQIPIHINIIGPNNNEELFNIDNLEGYMNFLCDKSGNYSIIFEKILNNNLMISDKIVKGTFKILSSEYPFNLDLTKDNIEFNEFNITGTESPSLTIKIEPLEKDYTKKISISNIEFNEINKIISFNKNTLENIPLKFPYYTFEKGLNYTIIINFNKKRQNIFTLENIKIKDFSQDNIQEFKKDKITYDDIEDKFLIINWEIYEDISISIKNGKAKFLLSELTEKQSQNLVKEFQNLNFILLNNLTITKPINTNYSALMIELHEKKTEINFVINYNRNDEQEKKSINENAIFLVTLLSLIVAVLIISILFITIIYQKKNTIIDLERQTKNLDNDYLMEEK